MGNSIWQQVKDMAIEKGASDSRAQGYADRAMEAHQELFKHSVTWGERFNARHIPQVIISDTDIENAVVLYNATMLGFKKEHSMDFEEERIDTHIAAGLWYCTLVQNPVFAAHKELEPKWQEATLKDGTDFMRLLANSTFYYSFRILRGHHSQWEEAPLYRLLRPVRNYMRHHRGKLAQSPAGPVGIFHTICAFDSAVLTYPPFDSPEQHQ